MIGPMRALAGAALLAAWERGAAEAPPGRALTLLRAGCPGLAEAEAAALPLPVRDIALLAQHAQSFGSTLAAFAACETCGERLEFALPAEEVATTLRGASADCTVARDGHTLRLRVANTRDVTDAAACPDLASARALLVARCTEATDAAGTVVALRDPDFDVALEQLEGMHAALEVSLAMACPACTARQTVHLDVAGFLWAGARHAALRLLDEVHELAWAYGWAEEAILAMSPQRRQAYLDRVHG